MCNLNKNQLLNLFFHEATEKEENKVREHVRQCTPCQEYLKVLEQANDRLLLLADEKPRPDTLQQIMKRIDRAPVQKPVEKPSFSLLPMIWIPISALAILVSIILVNNKLKGLPFWHQIENLWIINQLGTFGVTLFMVFLVGIVITLAVSPILIFESRSKQYGYRFH